MQNPLPPPVLNITTHPRSSLYQAIGACIRLPTGREVWPEAPGTTGPRLSWSRRRPRPHRPKTRAGGPIWEGRPLAVDRFDRRRPACARGVH
eukprot:scaffold6436_cov113-Isochrysis_galbana.AAC.14